MMERVVRNPVIKETFEVRMARLKKLNEMEREKRSVKTKNYVLRTSRS